jgi:hypothetical protein
MKTKTGTTDYTDYTDLKKTVLIKPCASLYFNHLNSCFLGENFQIDKIAFLY